MNLPIKQPTVAAVTMPVILEERAAGLISTGEGLAKLERLLQESFPQDKIKRYLTDLCEAEDTRITKFGSLRVPNWDARKNGLDRVLKLLKYSQMVENTGHKLPTRVVFNTIIQGQPSSVSVEPQNGDH